MLLLATIAALVAIAYIGSRNHRAEAVLSYYDKGSVTRSGEAFRKEGFTCAVGDPRDMDKWWRFEHNGRVVYAYANDLMPRGAAGKGKRFDLTPGAFARLAPLERGTLTDVTAREVQ